MPVKAVRYLLKLAYHDNPIFAIPIIRIIHTLGIDISHDMDVTEHEKTRLMCIFSECKGEQHLATHVVLLDAHMRKD